MKLRLTLIALVALLQLPAAVLAAEPGSKDDPLITRSYLDNLHSWQLTNLQEGQTISLDLGVMLVLTAGKAQVVGNGKAGLIDLTDGRELKDGERLPANHLLLSPASDRRGLRATSSATLLTRGLSR